MTEHWIDVRAGETARTHLSEHDLSPAEIACIPAAVGVLRHATRQTHCAIAESQRFADAALDWLARPDRSLVQPL
jgi:hypothetical protein